MPVRTDSQRNAKILQQLKLYMNETRKRQYELAAELDSPSQTVNRWITGKTTVSKAYFNLMLVKGILKG